MLVRHAVDPPLRTFCPSNTTRTTRRGICFRSLTPYLPSGNYFADPNIFFFIPFPISLLDFSSRLSVHGQRFRPLIPRTANGEKGVIKKGATNIPLSAALVSLVFFSFFSARAPLLLFREGRTKTKSHSPSETPPSRNRQIIPVRCNVINFFLLLGIPRVHGSGGGEGGRGWVGVGCVGSNPRGPRGLIDHSHHRTPL